MQSESFAEPESGTRYVLNDKLRAAFSAEGHLVIAGVVPRAPLARLSASITTAFESFKREGRLFSGGGTLNGHLNCFPGAESRFVYERLEATGILDMVRELADEPLRKPNIGCNLNLPGSAPQNEHVDGYASQPFLIVNVAAVDTDTENGAMEILRGTHQKDSKLWQIVWERPARTRVPMRQGDVLIRRSTLWHRGMPNRTARPRPMLAYTWEDDGSSRVDPYDAHEGQISFLPNRFGTDWASRLRERTFVALPKVSTAYRALRSLL